jgi:hypothetical protein
MVYSQLSDTLSILSREDAEICEGPYTYSDECWRAICLMANDKSPGSDGLPAEFYKAFFPEFGHIFVSIANSQYQHELALAQRTGIIYSPKRMVIYTFSPIGVQFLF